MASRRHFRLLVWLVAVAVVAGAGGCQSSDGLTILTDPHEIVTAGVNSTVALATVHAQVDLNAQNADRGAARQVVRFEVAADIDVQGRNLAGRVRMTTGDPQLPETTEFIAVDRTMFSRSGNAPRWFANRNGGKADHLPTNGAYAALIERAIADGNAVLELADPVPCGEATCYHVTAALTREATWQLLVAPLVGQTSDPPTPIPDGMVPTPGTVDFYVDQKSRLLMGIDGTFTVQTTGVRFSVVFSNHDLPIRIAPPPPQLVEDPNEGGGFAPAPTPVVAPS